MSDGQTHGERLEHKHFSRSREATFRWDPDASTLELEDESGDVAVMNAGEASALFDFLRRAFVDRTAMLLEAYALAKTQGDYKAMAEIASQL